MGRISPSDLKRIEAYFRPTNPDLPPLTFNDRDKDGRTDLFLPSGLPLPNDKKEVIDEWAALLRPVAIRNRESTGDELSRKDIAEHFRALTAKDGYAVLPNGLSLWVTHDPGAKIVSVGIAAFVDGIDEPPERVGMSHLLEHVLMFGRDHASGASWLDRIQSCGAQVWTAETDSEGTTYGVDLHPDEFEPCLREFGGMVGTEFYPADLVEKEIHGAFREEHLMRRADPSRVAITYQVAKRFAGHPLAQDLLGDWQTLSQVTPSELAIHHQTFYVPNNILLRVVGNRTLPQVIRAVADLPLGKARPGIIPRRGGEAASEFPRERLEVKIWGADGWPPDGNDLALVLWARPSMYENPKLANQLSTFGSLLERRVVDRLIQYNRENQEGAHLRYGSVSYSVGDAAYSGLAISLFGRPSLDLPLDAATFVLGEAKRLARFGPAPGELEQIRRIEENNQALEENVVEPQDRYRMRMLDGRFMDPSQSRRLLGLPAKETSSADVKRIGQKLFNFEKSQVLIVYRKELAGPDGKSPWIPEKIEAYLRGQVDKIARERPSAVTLPKVEKLEFPDAIKVKSLLAQNPEDLGHHTTRYVLKNGVTVIYNKVPGRSLLGMEIQVPLGRRTDPVGLEGLSDLYSQAFSQNLIVRKKEMLDFVGILPGGFDVGVGTTGFSFYLPVQRAVEGTGMILDAFRGASFSEQDLAAAKNWLQGGFQRDQGPYVEQLMARQLIGRDAIWQSTYVMQRGLEGMAPQHLRERSDQIQVPEGWKAFLVGDLGEEKLSKLVYLFSQLRPPGSVRPVSIQSFPPGENFLTVPHKPLGQWDLKEFGLSMGKMKGDVFEKDLPRPKVLLGFVTPPRDHPDYLYSLAFYIMVRRRLERSLVSSGTGKDPLLYQIRGGINEYGAGQPTIGKFHFEVAPEKLKEALKAIEVEICRLAQAGGIPQNELHATLLPGRVQMLTGWGAPKFHLHEVKEAIDGVPVRFLDPRGQTVLIKWNDELLDQLLKLNADQVRLIGSKYFFGEQRQGYIFIVGRWAPGASGSK